MLYRIYSVLLCSVSLMVSAYGQSNLKNWVLEKDFETAPFTEEQLAGRGFYEQEVVGFLEALKTLDAASMDQVKKKLGDVFFFKSLNLQLFAKAGLTTENNRAWASEILESLEGYWKAQGEWKDWATAGNILAINAYYEYMPQKAGIYYDRLMKEEAWKPLDTALCLSICIAAGNHYMGVEQNFEKAEKSYQEALKVNGGKAHPQSNVYALLSELYLRKRDFDRAIEYGHKFLRTDGISMQRQLQQLTRFGDICTQKGAFRKAKNYYLKAKALLQEDRDLLAQNSFMKASFVQVYTGLMRIACRQNKLKEAEEYQQKITQNFDLVNGEGQLNVTIVEQMLEYYHLTNQDEAYLDWEKISDEHVGHRLALYSNIYTIRGDFWFKKRELPKALMYYNQGLDLLKNQSDKEFEYAYTQDEPQALLTLMKKMDLLYWQKKQDLLNEESKQDLYQTTRQAVRLLEQIQQGLSTQNAKLMLVDAAPKIYEYALEVVWERYEATQDVVFLEELYQLMEKSKAMVLAEALNDSEAKAFGGIPDSLRKKEKWLQNDLKVYEQKFNQAQVRQDSFKIQAFQTVIFEKRSALEKLKKYLEANYPKYYELKFQSPVTPIEELQQALQAQQAIFVSYFVGERNLYVLKVDAQNLGIRVENLPSNLCPDFSKSIIQFRNGLSDVAQVAQEKKKDKQQYLKLGQRLYRMLLANELKEIQTSRLILSLDGLLHYIPFEALLTDVQDEKSARFDALDYLLKTQKISYNYTATLWLKSMNMDKKRNASSSGMLAMAATYQNKANKAYPEWRELREGLIELEGAAAEVYFLKSLYKGDFYLGEASTETIFRTNAEHYNVIHLALHGFVNNQNPMHSGLVFTENGDTLTDNLLLAYELSSLDLNADLLVLSACSTGDGHYQNGEGVMSLGRGFMYAGAASIMSTLWQINDESSQRIMQYFYANLYDGKPKDEALQAAKLEYINETDGIIAHPVFWAAYVLMGDIEATTIQQQSSLGWWIGGTVFLLLMVGLGIRQRKQ